MRGTNRLKKSWGIITKKIPVKILKSWKKYQNPEKNPKISKKIQKSWKKSKNPEEKILKSRTKSKNPKNLWRHFRTCFPLGPMCIKSYLDGLSIERAITEGALEHTKPALLPLVLLDVLPKDFIVTWLTADQFVQTLSCMLLKQENEMIKW